MRRRNPLNRREAGGRREELTRLEPTQLRERLVVPPGSPGGRLAKGPGEDNLMKPSAMDLSISAKPYHRGSPWHTRDGWGSDEGRAIRGRAAVQPRAARSVDSSGTLWQLQG
jgi:hypothetical protein